MNYINPYRIADEIGFKDLSNKNFIQFKKRVMNEMALEDDVLDVGGKDYHKSDFLELVNFVDRNDSAFLIFKEINDSPYITELLNGSLKPSVPYVISDLKLISDDALGFLKPYISKLLRDLYKEKVNQGAFNELRELPAKLVIDDQVYSPVMQYFDKIKGDLETYSEFLKGNDGTLSHLHEPELHQIISNLNQLPSFFQKQIDEVGKIIIRMSISSWNDCDNINSALNIIKLAKSLNVSRSLQNKFDGDLSDLLEIKANDEQRKKKEEQERWLIEQLGKIDLETLYLGLDSPEKLTITLIIRQINNQDDQELKDNFAYTLRSQSIEAWNEENDAQVALELINLSLSINVSSEIKEKFVEDKALLEQKLLDSQKSEKLIQDLKSLNIEALSKGVSTEKKTLLTRVIDYFNQEMSQDERDGLSVALRNQSIKAWNEESDINTALLLINKAKQLNISQEIRQKLASDSRDLDSQIAFLKSNLSANKTSTKSGGGWLWVVGIIILLIIMAN